MRGIVRSLFGRKGDAFRPRGDAVAASCGQSKETAVESSVPTTVPAAAHGKPTAAGASFALDETTDREFMFSVVVAAYNTARYLRAAFESLLNQTVGFDAIQVVLVNDGSTDDTDEVCRALQREWPRNVAYVSKPNGGASSARNLGIRFARGRYVSFMDSDDKWSTDSLAHFKAFFDGHPDVQVASARERYFERRTGDHPANYKFRDEDVVVDVTEFYNVPQTHACSAFVQRALLEDTVFQEGCRYAEDFAFMTELLLRVRRIGLLAEPVYLLRKRNDRSSLVDSSGVSDEYFKNVFEDVYPSLFDKSRELYGEVIPFVRFAVVNNMAPRARALRNDPERREAMRGEYAASYEAILAQTDERIILGLRAHSVSRRLQLVATKRGVCFEDVRDSLICEGSRLLLPSGGGALEVVDLAGSLPVRIDVASTDAPGRTLSLQGCLPAIALSVDKMRVRFSVQGGDFVEARVGISSRSALQSVFGPSIPALPVFSCELPVPSAPEDVRVEVSVLGGDWVTASKVTWRKAARWWRQ